MKRIIWDVYIVVLALFVVKKVYDVFWTESAHHLYYLFLIHFDTIYFNLYLANMLQVFLNIVMFLPLLGYVYRFRIFDPSVWQVYFVIKLFFDVVGHSFEVNYLLSVYRLNPFVFARIFAFSIITYIPAYIVLFRYSFTRDNALARLD